MTRNTGRIFYKLQNISYQNIKFQKLQHVHTLYNTVYKHTMVWIIIQMISTISQESQIGHVVFFRLFQTNKINK